MANAPFVGHPDIRVILRKKQYQWILPSDQQFDIDLSQMVSGFGTAPFRNENIYFRQELGAAFIRPIFANRNNFIENVSGSTDRYRVDVPQGAPAETENEINKRVWIARPTVNQDTGGPSGSSGGGNGGSSNSNSGGGAFKKPDQEFAQPGATEDLSGNPVDNRYPGPLWGEEFLVSNETGDPTAPRPAPVSWVNQKNSNPNTEFFVTQKYGNFTNESFWIDFKKFKSEKPSNINSSELNSATAGNRFNRYKRGEPLYNYIAIRIGANTEEDVFNPGGYDIVLPIGGTPFIYDHQGRGVTTEEEGDGVGSTNGFDHVGIVASEKTDAAWQLPNDLTDFRLTFWVIRNKLIIESSYAPGNPWFFPTELSITPFQDTQERYENFHIPAGKVSIFGRGVKIGFNYNPMEFNIYENGSEKDIAGDGRNVHARMLLGPFKTRKSFLQDGSSEGWIDFSNTEGSIGIGGGNSSDLQNFTIIPLDKSTNTSDGFAVGDAFGFDFIVDKYPTVGGQNYTSMMIGVNPDSKASISKLISTTMRPPDTDESKVVSPTGGPEGFDAQIQQGGLFLNQFLEIDFTTFPPEYGENTEGISKRFTSPVLWRVKGKMLVPDVPTPVEFDISDFVTAINYDASASSLNSVEQTYNIQVRVPKDWEFVGPSGSTPNPVFDVYSNPNRAPSRSGVSNRDQLLSLLMDGVKEVEVWLGYWGSRRFRDGALVEPPLSNQGIFKKGTTAKTGSEITRVFTGMTMGVSVKEQYDNDIVSLKCVDKTEMLKGAIIINSPLYDGMNLIKAFYHIGTLTGLPIEFFNVRSRSAFLKFLPMGYTFQEPKVKFPVNTNIYDAIKQIISTFTHTLRCDPNGKVTLTDLYDNFIGVNLPNVIDGLVALEDLNITHPDFVFHVDGSTVPFGEFSSANGGFGNQNPFQRCYEVFNFDKGFKSQVTYIISKSVDRASGAIMFSEQADVDAIENPDSPNFKGYIQQLRNVQPGFGEVKKLREYETLLKDKVFQNPLEISFTTFGRPTLRPLDIIRIVHQDPKFLRVKGEFVETSEINYRVMRISGEIRLDTSPWQYKMNINAIHM